MTAAQLYLLVISALILSAGPSAAFGQPQAATTKKASRSPAAKARPIPTRTPTGLSSTISAEELAVLTREQRRQFDKPFFQRALASKEPKVVIRALLALGRIGDPASLALILPELAKASDNSRYQITRAAAAAAGWIGDDKAIGPLQNAYAATPVIAVKSAAAKAIAAINGQASLGILERYYAKAHHPLLHAALAEALGQNFYRHKSLATAKITKATWLRLMADLKSESPLAARGSAFALYMAARKKAKVPAWVQKDIESELVAGISAAKSPGEKPGLDPYAAAYLVKLTALFPERRKGFLYPLLTMAVPQGLQVEAAKALFAAPKGGVQSDKIAAFLADPAMKPAVKAAMIDALAARGKASPVVLAAVKDLASPAKAPSSSKDRAWLADRAINAYVALSPKGRRLAAVKPWLTGSHRRAAIAALAHVPADKAIAPLLAASQGKDARVANTALDVLSGLDPKALKPAITTKPKAKSKAKATKSDTMADPRAAIARSCQANLARQDFVATHHCAVIVEKFGLAHLAPELKKAYGAISKPQQFEAKVAILKALGSFTGKVDKPFLRTAANDGSAAVREQARTIAQKQGIKDLGVSGGALVGTKVTPMALTVKGVNDALGRLMSFTTSKGRFVIKPSSAAPLTASYIAGLAGANFYKGLSFHRIVPDFVVQGGDPRGDGWGGADRLNPDEFQMHSHSRGTVGIATAGKDTGSCQFFVNLAPNTWLDGRYTVFGEVVSGMDVVDRLVPGDVIQSSQLLAAGVSH